MKINCIHMQNNYCLFATHFHELIDLEKSFEPLKNVSVKVIEDGSEVVFTHEVVDEESEIPAGDVAVPHLHQMPHHEHLILRDYLIVVGESGTEIPLAVIVVIRTDSVNIDVLPAKTQTITR